MDGEELSTERHNTELFSFIGALHVADSLSPCQSVAMAIKNLIQTRLSILFCSPLIHHLSLLHVRHLYPFINRQLSLVTIKCHHQNWYPKSPSHHAATSSLSIFCQVLSTHRWISSFRPLWYSRGQDYSISCSWSYPSCLHVINLSF